MPFIGNDIVDLTDPENRRKGTDARYISRILNPRELEMISGSPDPDTMLWSLWACKEASYKALVKARKVSSSPLKYSVLFGPQPRPHQFTAIVETPEGEVSVLLTRRKKYVHAVASTGGEGSINSLRWAAVSLKLPRKEITPDIQSRAARGAAIMSIAKFLKKKPEQLDIIRRALNAGELGPPILLLDGAETGIDISLSHDGLYLAYAFQAGPLLP